MLAQWRTKITARTGEMETQRDEKGQEVEEGEREEE